MPSTNGACSGHRRITVVPPEREVEFLHVFFKDNGAGETQMMVRFP